MRTVGLCLCLALTACGAQQLPPPPAPTREVPALDLPDGPPAAGTGRVIVDTNGERARVSEIASVATATTYRGNMATIVDVRPLCTTPCVLDLPYGTHPLVLQSTSDESHQSSAELDVGPRQKVFRHALGERTDGGPVRTIGLSLMGLGLVTALTGAVLWGTGAMIESSEHRESSITGPGQVITGIGAAAMLVSLPFLFLARPTERPGTTTEWTVPTQKDGPRAIQIQAGTAGFPAQSF
jgi:hypothetical protein